MKFWYRSVYALVFLALVAVFFHIRKGSKRTASSGRPTMASFTLSPVPDAREKRRIIAVRPRRGPTNLSRATTERTRTITNFAKAGKFSAITDRATFGRKTPTTPSRKTRKKQQVLKECDLSERSLPRDGLNTYNLFNNLGQRSSKLAGGEGGRQRPGSNPATNKTSPSRPGLPKLKVLLVPFSHNDPGWLKTLQEYYIDQTSHILDNMVVKLELYPNMTFIWAETVFLAMWWEKRPDEAYRARVRKLIERGQLEIVNGGWVAPDQATTHYSALIDLLVEGHQWLEKNLGVKPTVSWSPDPFGYSSTMPYLLNRAGMVAMVINRVHSDVKTQLRQRKSVEFYWSQQWGITHASDTSFLTYIMPYLSYPIRHSCGPDPDVCRKYDYHMMDSRPITDENVEELSAQLVDAFRKKSENFRHNVLLYTFGDDFRFAEPTEWDQQYMNHEKLFKYINSRKDWKVEAKFGTLSEYFTLVKNVQAKGAKFPKLYGGFFPYLDFDETYWTGFFTSRPFLKQLEREVRGDLRSAEILNSLAASHQSHQTASFEPLASNLAALTEARRHLALFQHHDAVTGTSRSRVAQDYEWRLWSAKELANKVKVTSGGHLLRGQGQGQRRSENQETIFLNVDDARNSENIHPKRKAVKVTKIGIKVIIFNPIAKNRFEMVRLRVTTPWIKVVDSEGVTVRSQINPRFDGIRVLESDYELIFPAKIPPLGMSSFLLTEHAAVGQGRPDVPGLATPPVLFSRKNLPDPGPFKIRKLTSSKSSIVLENERIKVVFNGKGLLRTITSKIINKSTKIALSFMVYRSGGGGAYVFKPSDQAGNGFFYRNPRVVVLRGPLSSEIRLEYSILDHTIRLFHTPYSQPLTSVLEVENRVDLSPQQVGHMETDNREIIMRFETDIKSGPIWYTDLNGFDISRHKRRDDYIQANYHPMTTMAYVEGKTARFSILSAQSHGAASLREGHLEVMLDRKVSFLDGKGLQEGISDNRPTTSRFFLLLENADLSKAGDETKLSFPSLLGLALSDQLQNKVTNFIVEGMLPPSIRNFRPLSTPLPCDVSIVNLRTLDGVANSTEKSFALTLHRPAYQCGFKTDDILRSMGCSLTGGVLSDLARDLKVKDVTEMTLSLMYEKERSVDPIRLGQMEIATYKLTSGAQPKP